MSRIRNELIRSIECLNQFKIRDYDSYIIESRLTLFRISQKSISNYKSKTWSTRNINNVTSKTLKMHDCVII